MDSEMFGSIVDLPYQPAAGRAPVEVFTLRSLRNRQGDSQLVSPQRLAFHLLIVGTERSGQHEVDFAPVAVRPGRVVHVRPGQVHRWILQSDYEATLVLFRAPPGVFRSRTPQTVDLTKDGADQLAAIAQLVTNPSKDGLRSMLGLAAIRDLITAFLQSDEPPDETLTAQAELYQDFCQLLDVEPPCRSVTGAARRLGCSTRTLSRACISYGDCSPKELIDQRLSLSARRLLSTSGSSITDIAVSLGFRDLSHFTRFFCRLNGETPTTFRRRYVDSGQQEVEKAANVGK